MPHTILVPEETRTRATDYLLALRTGDARPGKYLATALGEGYLSTLTDATFLDALINTKIPQIFAESAVAGDGTDWNLTELGILGDISISVPVTVFDNGLHSAPTPHLEPFAGTLVFTPGALLLNGRGCTPADWDEATLPDDSLDPEGYHGLYERRLLPVFQHVDAINRSEATHKGKITEHLAALFLNDVFDPRDIRFVGSPIDLIVFHGLSAGYIEAIHLIEVKSGKYKTRDHTLGIFSTARARVSRSW